MNIQGFNEYNITRTGIITRKGKELKPITSKDGYLKVNLSKDGKNYTKYIHRLVALAYLPKQSDKYSVIHKNNNKTDNNIDNLMYVDYKQNQKVKYPFEISTSKLLVTF